MYVKNISTIVLFFFIVTFSSNSKAQQAAINLSLAIPQGEFGEEVDNVGFGLGGEFLIISPKPNSPFGFGFNLGYYVYGIERRREPWSLTIPDVYLDVERTNNLFNFHVLFQVGVSRGKFRPYFEGLFGGEYLYTQTSVKGTRDLEEISSSVNFDDWAWSYGVGGGIAILLSGDPETELDAVYLDLKARYLFGSEAVYLKEGSVEVSSGQVRYYPSESKTDLLTIHAGVRIALSF